MSNDYKPSVLRERFCKDMRLPIRVFDDEDIFMSRLRLCDPFYKVGGLSAVQLYMRFKTIIAYKYCNADTNMVDEQTYFEDYNRTKDAVIDTIKASDGYNRLQEDDMNKYALQNVFDKEFVEKLLKLQKDIFHQNNSGRKFISFDIRKANFSCLKLYDPTIFNADDWETFMSGFTTNRHIIDSKYIREVIFGVCNPKRHIVYEKYVCATALKKILEMLNANGFNNPNLVFFSNDEFIFDVTDYDNKDLTEFRRICDDFLGTFTDVPLRMEYFTLCMLETLETDNKTVGYLKLNATDSNVITISDIIAIKGVDSMWMPFVLRSLLHEEYQPEDYVFYDHGLEAVYQSVPKITMT